MPKSFDEIIAERSATAATPGPKSFDEIIAERQQALEPEEQRSFEEIIADRTVAEEIGQDAVDYDTMRRGVRDAKFFAELEGDPRAKYEAAAKAEYLKNRSDKAESLGASEYIETGGAIPGHMPGEKTKFYGAMDTADAFVSWASRPTHSALSVAADMDYIDKMRPADFSGWIENLHPDDPRKDIYRGIHKNLLARGSGQVNDPALEGEKQKLAMQLGATYWVPNAADPYGGGVPRPWQDLERGGRVVGGDPNTTADLWIRGLAAKVPFSPIDTGPEGNVKSIHTEMQRLGGEFLAVAPQVPSRLAQGLLGPIGWAGGKYINPKMQAYADWQRARVEKGIEEGDENVGLLLPTLFYSIGPDFLVPGGLISGLAKTYKTGAGLLTKTGDLALHNSIRRHNTSLLKNIEEATAAGKVVSPEDLAVQSRKLEEGIKENWALVGDAAAKGERFNVEPSKATGVGLERFEVGKIRPFDSPLEVVHIDIDDAVKMKDGVFEGLDATKVKVLYADDDLVKGFAKRVEDGQEARKALFGKAKGVNLPLAAFGATMAGTVGWAYTDEDDPLLKRLGIAAGAAALGAVPGAPVGRVVDETGKMVVKTLAFKDNKVAFSEITNDPVLIDRLANREGSRLSKIGSWVGQAQQKLPFFKRFQPWAVHVKHEFSSLAGKPGVSVDYWKPLEPTDFMGTHAWIRMEYLARRRGTDVHVLMAEANETIHKSMKGTLLTPRDRDILAHFTEALGQPVEHGEEAASVFKALKAAVMASVQFAESPRVRPGQPAVVKKGKVVEEAAFREMGLLQVGDDVVDLRGRPIPKFPSEDVAGGEASLSIERAVSGVLEDAGRDWARRVKSAANRKGIPEHTRVTARGINKKLTKKQKKMFGEMSDDERIRAIGDVLGKLEKAGLAHGAGAPGIRRGYVAEPALWESFVRDVTEAGKLKPRASAAVRRLMRGEMVKVIPEGRGMPRQEIVDGVPTDMPLGKPGDPIFLGQDFDDLLSGNVGSALLKEIERAEIAEKMMRQMTGVADLDELIHLTKLRKELEATLSTARARMSDEAFSAAVEKMTVQEVRASVRAVARTEAKYGKGVKVDPRWEALSQDQKDSVDAARQFFVDMYNLLKAEGSLKGRDMSLASWMEMMEVEGYVHHLFTNKGRAKFAQLGRKFTSFKKITTEADFLKKRSAAGTIEEVNEGVRRGIAEMIHRERMLKAGTQVEKGAVLSDEVKNLIIKEEGLDKIKFFETDAARIMERYAKKVSRQVSNKRYADNLISMFPEGEAFAALGRLGRGVAELEAAAAGYRRVDNLKYMRSILGQDYWSGWDKYHAQIKNIMRTAKTKEAADIELFNFLKTQGVDLADQRVVLQGKTIGSDIYLPYAYADMVEALGDTSWLDQLAHEKTWARLGLGAFDDVLSFFKTATTVLYPAFHGRNAISNVITNLMTHGFAAVSPRNQIDSIHLMRADDDALWTLVQKTEGGQEFRETKRVGDWKRELRMQGIIADHLNPSDIRGSKYGNRPGWKAPAMTGSAGAILGAGVGYSDEVEEGPEWEGLSEEERAAKRASRKSVKAFAGALLGGAAGFTGMSAIELFAKRPYRAYKAEKSWLEKNPENMENAKSAFSVAFDEWLDMIGYEAKLGHSVGRQAVGAIAGSAAFRTSVVGGIAGGGVGAFVPSEGEGRLTSSLKAAVGGMLLTGGAKTVSEGAFILGGGFGRKIEEQAKIVNYLAGRKSGLSPDAAADVVHKTLFNYDDLTSFERHWLRRVFPFYTWTSKNATELQPFLLKERPLEYAALTKVLDAAENSFSRQEDMNLLPDHLQYRAAFAGGLGKIVAGFGLPQEDLVDLFKLAELGSTGAEVVPSGLISRIHPIIPFISRFVFKHDPYYNVPVRKIRSARDVRYLPEGLKRWAGYNERTINYTDSDGVEQSYIKYEVGWFPSKKSAAAGIPWDRAKKELAPSIGSQRLALLRSVPTWRLAVEWNKAMTDTFMGGISAAYGEEASTKYRLAAIFTGIKPYSVDWDRLERYAYIRFNERLNAVLEERGQKLDISIVPKHPARTDMEKDVLRDMGLPVD